MQITTNAAVGSKVTNSLKSQILLQLCSCTTLKSTNSYIVPGCTVMLTHREESHKQALAFRDNARTEKMHEWQLLFIHLSSWAIFNSKSSDIHNRYFLLKSVSMPTHSRVTPSITQVETTGLQTLITKLNTTTQQSSSSKDLILHAFCAR